MLAVGKGSDLGLEGAELARKELGDKKRKNPVSCPFRDY